MRTINAGTYNSTPPTVDDAGMEDIQLDVNGNQKVVSADKTATDTARTTDTEVLPVQHIDAAGTVGGVTQNTLQAGEDLTNDVMKVEQRFSYHYIAAPAANEVVKASAGFVHAIILGAWVTGGTVEVSDHASDGDGNVKIKLTAGATDESGFPKTIPVNASFATGITVDTIGLTDVTIIYR